MLHLPTPVPSPAPPPISTSNQAALSQLAHVTSLHQQHPHPRSSVQKAPPSSQQTRGGLYLPTTTSTPKHATSTSPSVTRALPNVTNASPNTGLHHQTPNFPLSIQTGFTSQASSAILQNTIPQRNYQTNNSDLYKQCQPQPPSAKSNPCKRKRIIACLNCHKNKKKCSTGVVCSYCERTGRRCVYPDTKPGRYQTGKNPTPKVQKRQESVRLYQEQLARMKELELEMQQQFPHFPGTQPVYQQPVYQQEPVIMSVHEAITIIDDTPPHSPAPVIVHDTPPQSPTLLIMSPQAPALSVDHSILDALGLDIPGINDVQSCTSTSESPGPVQSTATTPIDIPSIEDLLEPLETSKAKPAPQASTPEKTAPPTEFTPLAELIEHLPSAGPLTPESEGEMSGCSNVDISFGMSLIEDDEDLEAFLSSVSATAPAADSLDFSPNGDIKWFEDFPDAGDYDDEGPVVSVCAPPTPEEIISRETWERNLFGDMIGV